MIGFLDRIAQAIGASQSEMAFIMGIKRTQYKKLQHLPLAQLGDSMSDPAWEQLETHVKTKLAGYMVAERALADKRHSDAQDAIKRHAEQRAR